MIYRILISLGVSIAMMFLSTVVMVYFNRESPAVLAMVTLVSFTVTFKAIPKSQKEIDRKNTVINEVLSPEGILRERGPLLNGKRTGEWSIFDEQGQYIRTDIYDNDVLVSSKTE